MLGLSACGAPSTPSESNVVNDITQLNPIIVARVVEPRSIGALARLVGASRGPIAIGGGRFSQGGQTACDGALAIDMRPLNRILVIDAAAHTITVQAGATWRQIQEALDPLDLPPAIMQSFSNFTVGGSLSVDCHGDYAGLGPIVESVRSLRIILADGSIQTASRSENRDLFRAAIGGYGGVGVIAEATLDLADNAKLERVTHRMTVEEYPAWHRANVLGKAGVILHHAVVYPSAYTTIAAEVSSLTDKPLTVPDRLSPTGEPTAFQRSLLSLVTHAPFGEELHEHYDPLIGAAPEVVWRNYEAAGDVYGFEPQSRERTTYALQEYFVPVARFDTFIPRMARILRDARANVLNIAIRHTRADEETLLAWAREEVYSFVLYYAQGTDEAARLAVGAWTRELVDAALAEGGSFYLPYQIHATPAQFDAAYPRAQDYFAIKRRVDPDYKFRNRLWEAYYR
ncbi:MAG: FAD-binding oxidoreductase [Vitreimonas sp.]